MSDAQQPVPTSDDRIMAALAHGAIILGLWGVVISAIIWGTQKEKSATVRFQALQALVYQICDTVSMLLLGLLWGFCGTGFMVVLAFLGVLAMAATADLADPSVTPVPFFFFNVLLLVGIGCLVLPILLIRLALIVYAFYGAYQAYQGRDFRYAVIGPRVERYLARS